MKGYHRAFIIFCFLPLACQNNPVPEHIEKGSDIFGVDSIMVTDSIDLTNLDDDLYTVQIDSLVSENQLETVSFPSLCGGESEGLYYQGELVYMQVFREEKYGSITKTCYVRNGIIYKMIETIHAPLPEWGIPDPTRDPHAEEDGFVSCKEVRIVEVSDREMTILRDEEPIVYYPESHDGIMERNIECANEMQQTLDSLSHQ